VAEGGVVDLAEAVPAVGLQQRRGPQQAADLVGTEGVEARQGWVTSLC
jgi:hypothetical protein